jgi:ADP-ribose pyrophosphatase YjhB (NUDIX family)
MNYVADLRALVGVRPLILAGTSVLVLDERGHLLLIERGDTGDWGLPGGFMELGESFEDTGRREVREETGLEVDDFQLVGVFSGPELYFRYDHGDEVHNVTAAYLARVVGGQLRQDGKEAISLRFFALDALPEDILPPERPILRCYLARQRSRSGQ